MQQLGATTKSLTCPTLFIAKYSFIQLSQLGVNGEKAIPNLRNGSKGGLEPRLTWLRVRYSTTKLPRSTKWWYTDALLIAPGVCRLHVFVSIYALLQWHCVQARVIFIAGTDMCIVLFNDFLHKITTLRISLFREWGDTSDTDIWERIAGCISE